MKKMSILNRFEINKFSLICLLLILVVAYSCINEENEISTFQNKNSREEINKTMINASQEFKLSIDEKPFIFSCPQVEAVVYSIDEASIFTKEKLQSGSALLFFYLKTAKNGGRFYKLTLTSKGLLQLFGGKNLSNLLGEFVPELLTTTVKADTIRFIVKYDIDRKTNLPYIKLGIHNGAIGVKGQFLLSVFVGDENAPRDVSISVLNSNIKQQINYYKAKIEKGFSDLTAKLYTDNYLYAVHDQKALMLNTLNLLEGLEYKNLVKNQEYGLFLGIIEKEDGTLKLHKTTLMVSENPFICRISHKSDKGILITSGETTATPTENQYTSRFLQISYEYDSWTYEGHTSSCTYSDFHFDGIHIEKFETDVWWD
jgi:hypothetical protein